MYHDAIDVIKNLQTLSENNSAFKVLKDFERVIDELDLYVFKHWEDGELSVGPIINRYTVTCKFMWPRNEIPDPAGAKRLRDYGCKVVYDKDHIMIPRKIKEPSDYRPGTKKGKIDAHPIWLVTINMPKKLMQDIFLGQDNRDHNQMAELMHYNQEVPEANVAAQETPQNVEPPPAPANPPQI